MTIESRYSRQTILQEIGIEGQRAISSARIVVVGVGATGSVSSTILARAGVGFLRVVDRDIVEVSNLQRQFLYDEEDAREGCPKAPAAKRKLSAMNEEITVDAVSDHLSPRNIDEIIGEMDIVIDGTDNMETRYLINDYCVRERIPWVYGGALGTVGMSMLIEPVEGPCFRCLFRDAVGSGRLGTCETDGVLGSAPAAVGSHQAMAALRHLVSAGKSEEGRLLTFDLWREEYSLISVRRDPDCPTCGRRVFPYLDEDTKTAVAATCGEGAYQVYPPSPGRVDLREHAERLEGRGEVSMGSHYLTFRIGSKVMNVFADGRAQLKGMRNQAEALSFYAKYLGM